MKIITLAGLEPQLTPPTRTLKEHSDAVYAVAFSPDSRMLASCSADRSVKVWDVAAGKLLYTLGDATDWLYTVAWSRDGKRLASGGVDKSIRVYETSPGGAKIMTSVFAHEAAGPKNCLRARRQNAVLPRPGPRPQGLGRPAHGRDQDVRAFG